MAPLFAATSTIKSMAAGPIATPNTVAALNATLSSGLAALKQLSANWTGDNSTLPLMQANGLCPSGASSGDGFILRRSTGRPIATLLEPSPHACYIHPRPAAHPGPHHRPAFLSATQPPA